MSKTTTIGNKIFKLVKSLKQKKFREENKLFIAEGEKICRELLTSEYQPAFILLKNISSDSAIIITVEFSNKNISVHSLDNRRFEALCDAKTPQNILAVVNIKAQKYIADKPFIILDRVSDPGNLGTIIRTADWFGFPQIFLSNGCADIYNPKVVRSTMGSLFRVSIIEPENILEFLSINFKDYQILGASLQSQALLSDIEPPQKFGLVFGSESHGISDDIKKIISKEFKIPGKGKTESLNVAIAAAIVMYHFSLKK